MSEIPFIDLKRTTKRLQVEVHGVWSHILNTCEFVGGEGVKKLESALAQQLKVQDAMACSNGTDAISIALQAAGIDVGMKVALPNLTFWATYEAIVRIGAVPVLVDIDPRDLQMSFEQFEAAYAKHRFEGLLFVHLYGWTSAKLEQFRRFSREKGIRMVEDAAQAYGVRHGTESIFTGASVSTLSFYPAKVIGGCMDGGAILSSNAQILNLCRTLGNHGRSSHYGYSHVGWNCRMSGVNARYLLSVCEHASEILKDRRSAEEKYRKRLSEAKFLEEVEVFGPPANVQGNGYLNVIRIKKRSVDEVAKKLNAKGIGTGRVYPSTLDEQPPAKESIRFGDLQASHDFVKGVLSLPLFWGITEDEVERSVEALEEVLFQ